MKSRLVIIAAVGKNLAIGVKNHLPWNIPEDTAFFQTKTLGKPLIMGYNTFVSLGEKPLKQRYNIVISDHEVAKTDLPSNLVYAASLEEALELADQQDSRWVMSIGGGQIYKQTLPLAEEMYLTLVDLAPDGDVFFPAYDATEWEEKEIKSGTSNGVKYRIVHFLRK